MKQRLAGDTEHNTKHRGKQLAVGLVGILLRTDGVRLGGVSGSATPLEL